MCRSRRELSNAYLLAKFGFDTAENEPSGDVDTPGGEQESSRPRGPRPPGMPGEHVDRRPESVEPAPLKGPGWKQYKAFGTPYRSQGMETI